MGCSRLLCVQCAERVATAATHFDACSHCQGVVQVLMVPGVERPFERSLGRFLAIPLGGPTLLALTAMLAVATAWHSLESARAAVFVPGTVLLGWLLGVAYVVMVHGAASGPDVAGHGASFSPRILAIQGLWLAGPFTLALALPRLWAGAGLHDASSMTGRPGAVALVALAGVLWPILGARAVTGPVPRLLGALLPGLGLCIALTLLLVIFAHLMLWNSVASDELGLGLWAFCLRVLAGLTVLGAGWLHGLLVHARAIELGYPLDERYQVPAVPGAVPARVRGAGKPAAADG